MLYLSVGGLEASLEISKFSATSSLEKKVPLYYSFGTMQFK